MVRFFLLMTPFFIIFKALIYYFILKYNPFLGILLL